MTKTTKQYSPNPTKSDREIPTLWKLEEQIREKLKHGVRALDGSFVAVLGSPAFTYLRYRGDMLFAKYIDGCVVVTASAEVAGEEVKVYDVSVHNICGDADI